MDDSSLNPTDVEHFEVVVAKATPQIRRWSGKRVADDYGGKAILLAGDRPAFAEQWVVHTLTHMGWQAAWIDSFRGGTARGGYADEAVTVDLPPRVSQRLRAIQDRAGKDAARAWDVVAWKDDSEDLLFVECKRANEDALRDTQRAFFESALREGVSLDSFLIVEWSIPD